MIQGVRLSIVRRVIGKPIRCYSSQFRRSSPLLPIAPCACQANAPRAKRQCEARDRPALQVHPLPIALCTLGKAAIYSAASPAEELIEATNHWSSEDFLSSLHP